jgi:hypothetical protein
MAISVTSPEARKSGFIKNATSADASACEEIIAAPGAGKNIFIEYLVISSDSAISVTIGAGETTGAVTTALIGPVTFAAGQTIPFPFTTRTKGLKVAANTSLTVDSSGAGAINVWVQGYIE